MVGGETKNVKCEMMDLKEKRRRALARQISRLQGRLGVLERLSDRYVPWRLILFVAGAIISGFTLLNKGTWWLSLISLLAFIPFIAVLIAHRRVEISLSQYQNWLEIKNTHLARMTLDWGQMPPPEPIPPRLNHPFALDLDLIGERSIHHLLDTAVSREGSLRLRDWLLATTPDLDDIVHRQAVIQELAGLPTFRDKLLLQTKLIGDDNDEKWPGQRLLAWLDEQTIQLVSASALMILIPLGLINVILGFLSAAGTLPPIWVFSWAIYMVISVFQIRRIGPVFQEAFFLRDGLEKLQAVFDFLETYRYGRNQSLKKLCSPFTIEENRPSHHLKQIRRVVAAVSLQKNPFAWFFLNALIPWDIFFAQRLYQCKQALAKSMPVWLDVWFELEALNSLANFAYLNPSTIYPTIVTDQKTLFQTEAIGHPLIADETRICNDYGVRRLGAIDIITGSNMAGKSSFLRTLGVNLSLAYAGGPVLAQSMQTSLFRLYTSIRITDSVTDGFSYFYAEVQRLLSLLKALKDGESLPLFFLIDEIFRGTNNRERFIGSQSYLKALSGGNGVGLIATHDLDLITLEKSLPGIKNYHFRDDVKNGRMVFDYTLYPGPCPTTNAIKIMKMAGLPISNE